MHATMQVSTFSFVSPFNLDAHHNMEELLVTFWFKKLYYCWLCKNEQKNYTKFTSHFRSTFTFMHLADAFIQSDLVHSGKFFVSML